jgi:polyisoprenoid-binding protein YceI
MTTADGQQQVRPEQPGPATLTGPSRWTLDPARSSVTLRHKTMWGLVTVRGAFGDLAGQAEIGADGSARGRLEIGAASLDTGNAKRDKHLRSADFFGADAHPRIVAVLDRAELHRDELHRAGRHRAGLAGGATVTVTGQLTVAGITRPLTFTATLAEVTESAVTVRAEAEVDRGQFDMTWNQLGMLRGPARVSVLARFTRA